MDERDKLWAKHVLKIDQTLCLVLGGLIVWVHRGKQEWHVASEYEHSAEDRFEFSITDDAPDPELDWTRYIVNEKVNSISLSPLLPDRAVIVRPEMKMSVLPRESIQFFVGIPVWLGLTFGEGHKVALEIPSIKLSNSWFGSVTEGELCYAMKTTAKLHAENLLPSTHRAIFPLEVRNLSEENLNFERLCLRVQYLTVFMGNERLWTCQGRVSYRGADKWSRIVYSKKAPPFDQARKMLSKARATLERGVILNTFDNLKHLAEL